MSLPALRVAVVDSRFDRGESLCALLRDGGLDVVLQLPSERALDDIAEAPDVVVAGMSDDADVERRCAPLVRATRARWPEVRIVAVADELSARCMRDAFAAGVDALVLASDAERSLALAVRAAHAGQVSVPAEWRQQFGKPSLSARQKQVLAMVVMGFTNARIAATLGVAESTVKSHLFSAFKKLGVRSRKEASALILDPENGLGSGILTIPGAGDEP